MLRQVTWQKTAANRTGKIALIREVKIELRGSGRPRKSAAVKACERKAERPDTGEGFKERNDD
ncbi:hypothetical protein [Syntrophus aciditrophicus]|uniref:hypothetical protein n=1 Tax=Syntrophus aciditrophicus TaxID=316277 RepID=UPI0002DB9922|nr:hypothetical protein [Syntrophus aciditrophicus]